VVVDSRQVTPGVLFVALKGQKHDGHDFISQALGHGAIAVLAQRVPESCRGLAEAPDGPAFVLVDDTAQALQRLAGWWRRRFPVQVVGITGSVGKTSTKEVTAALLRRWFRVLSSEGNLNSEIGVPLTLLRLDGSQEKAVVEMGMYGRGEIALLAELARPQVGVVTRVEPVHLERVGSIEAIASAKAELVEALPADGVALLNADDERVAAMATRTVARPLLYGLSPTAELRAVEPTSHGLRGIEFDAVYAGRRDRVRTPLLGLHSVHIALAAIGVAISQDVPFDEACGALAEVEQGLRLVVVEGINGSTIVDDTYNAGVASMLAALSLLEELPGRHVAVLGDMLELGETEEASHRKVGRRVADVAQVLIAVGPRARWIAEEAEASGLPSEHVQWAATTEEAIALLERLLRPGDYVLVKGSRGMRMETIVQAIRLAEE